MYGMYAHMLYVLPTPVEGYEHVDTGDVLPEKGMVFNTALPQVFTRILRVQLKRVGVFVILKHTGHKTILHVRYSKTVVKMYRTQN